MKFVEINWNPTDRQLRQFGVISALVLPGVAWYREGSQVLVIGLAAIGIAIAVVGWFCPRGLKPLFVGLTIVAIPIGMIVGELALLAIYFFVFLPIGLAFRFAGRNSLRLKHDRNATTYWQSKPQPVGVANYYRQS